MPHTKGPWRVGHYSDNGYSIYSENPVGIVVKGGVTEANAKLISCSPELLEACKFVLSELEDMTTEQFSRGEDKAFRERLEKVIAKATGETP